MWTFLIKEIIYKLIRVNYAFRRADSLRDTKLDSKLGVRVPLQTAIFHPSNTFQAFHQIERKATRSHPSKQFSRRYTFPKPKLKNLLKRTYSEGECILIVLNNNKLIESIRNMLKEK